MRPSKTSIPTSPLRRLACLALPALALAVAAQGPARAEPGNGTALERRVKAAFLYKFLVYADFPPGVFADASSPMTIAVAGSDEMLAELARTVAGRQVGGRPIAVRPLREGEVGGQAQIAHLLFVAGPDCGRAGRLLRGVPAAMLTVTECEDGLQHGSVINFRIIDERVRFDVSLDAAERNNVKLSSRLLSVANRVRKGGA